MSSSAEVKSQSQASTTPEQMATTPQQALRSPGKAPADEVISTSSVQNGQDPNFPEQNKKGESTGFVNPRDPYSLRDSRIGSGELAVSIEKLSSRKQTRVKKYYNRQNALIDAFLGSTDEEALEVEDGLKNGGKVRFAVNASFVCNFFLFVIQLYAAISTGSPALFATAADAFMDLVSSVVMLITSRLAARPKLTKFPVGRKRVETVGIILFCALMTTVAVQLIIESVRSLTRGQTHAESLKIIPIAFVSTAIFAKGCLFVYCFLLRRYPAAHIFMIDHRNDIAVNIFGLTMSIVASRYVSVWYLDPTCAICIALLILYSWASTAFEHMWQLVGKTAPQETLNKLVYVSLTHDARIQRIDTVRAYHAGTKFYAEVDIIMAEEETLKVTHDVGQTLQRKLEGLADVERAFVHVDYEGEHDVHEEHKALYDRKDKRRIEEELSAELLEAGQTQSQQRRGVFARLFRR